MLRLSSRCPSAHGWAPAKSRLRRGAGSARPPPPAAAEGGAVLRGLAPRDGGEGGGARFAGGVLEPPVVELDADLGEDDAVLGDLERDLGPPLQGLLGARPPVLVEGGGVRIHRVAQE